VLFVVVLMGSVSAAEAREEITLQLKWKHAFQFAGFYMAQEKGYYQSRGLHVTLLEGGPDRDPVAFSSGSAGHYGITDTGVVLARAAGAPVKVLAAVFQHSPLALAVRADSDIYHFADLKGKRLMMQSGNMDAVILAAIKKAGVGLSDITRLPTSFQLQDLVQGTVDAFSVYVTDQPNQLRAMGVAHRVLNPRNEGIDFYGDVLITSEQEVTKHPQRVQAFLDASMQGWTYALNHMDETVELIMHKYNSQHLSRSQLHYEAIATSEVILKDVVRLGYMNEERWQTIADTYTELGLIQDSFQPMPMLYMPEPSVFEQLGRYGWQLAALALLLLLLIFALQSLLLRRMVRSRTTELSESEQRFRTLVANLPGASYRCHCDADRAMDYISDGVQSMTGFAAAEFIHNSVRSFNSIIHPDDRDTVRRTVVAAIAHRERYTIEYRIIRQDGQQRWLREHGQPVYDHSGEAKWLDGNLFDISDSKQSDRLRESIADILEMIAGDQALHEILAAINECYECRYPDMRTSILLLRDGHLYRGSAPSLPESYNAALDGIAIGPLVGSCGTAAYYKKRVIVEDIEHDPRWADYTELVLPLGLRACWSEPIINADGEVLGTFAMYYDHACAPGSDEIHDIAEAARLAGIAIERDRNLSRLKKLSRAIDQSGEVVTITDRVGVIEYINPAFSRITGYSQQQAIGKVPRLLRDEGNQGVVGEIRRVMDRGESWQGKVMEKKKDGSLYPAMLTISPIRDEKGVLTHYISVHEDLSQLQALEEKFQQAQKMESIGTLVGGIAHDFNNMLAAMQGNLYLMRPLLAGQKMALAKLDNIEQLSHRAADMVGQLLTFARKGMVHMQSLCLNSFMLEAYTLSLHAIPEDIETRCDVCDEKLVVMADATQLQQLLLNLLSNARSAVRETEDPRINCRLDLFHADAAFKQRHEQLKGDCFARISVLDNGCGIPEAIRDKIFEPFFTTKPVGDGTGLGLSMIYGAVQTHGGVIELDCDTETTFHVYLPLTTDTALPLHRHDAGVVTGKNDRILLVDDDRNMREVTCEVLRSLHYRVTTSETGKQALELFKQSPDAFDLVITDMVMPQMNGDAMAKQMLAIRPDLPVIFCSGYDRAQAGKSVGNDEGCLYLQKPFEIEKLSQSIRALLSA